MLVEQNEWEQAEIIRVATKKNQLSDLYWFIQMLSLIHISEPTRPY